jgi:hypothetical protein
MGIKQKQLDDDYDDWAAAEGQSKSVNDIQHGGDHYKNRAIQPWDYVIANDMGYLEGTIVKYITRYKDKNGVEDLMKARHFLDKLIEVTNERS